MALKDIFTMVKADRYTADGREEVIKAQEAETEDKTYQIGEISQKTGLQKTANGWVKPKSGKAPGAKTGPGTTPKAAGSKPTQTKAERQTEAAKQKFDRIKEGDEVTAYGTKVKIVRKRANGTVDVEFESDNGEKVVSNLSMGDIEENASTESKPATPEVLSKVSHDNLDIARNQMNTTPEEDQMLDYFVTEMHEDGTSLDEIIKRQDGIYARSNGAYPQEEKTYKSLREKIMNHYGKTDDAAPRVLTGDTRIRVRKA